MGETLDSKIKCISQMIWWIELIDWMIWLHADSRWIIFGLITNILSIFEICLVSTTVVLVLRMTSCFYCPKEENFAFLNVFNKSLIKCGKVVSCPVQYSKNTENDHKLVLILHSYWTPQFQNFVIPCYPCYCFLTQ